MRVRSALHLILVVLATFLLHACKDDQPLHVRRLSFDGVRQVRESDLRATLATKQGSRLPFTKKPGFERRQFVQDLTRIKTFYASQGFPDARVTDVDIELDEEHGQVDVAVRIDEGEPVRVAAVERHGLDVLPAPVQNRLARRAPLDADDVRRPASVIAAREEILRALHEHGFPYATVDVQETHAPDDKHVRIVFDAHPGTSAHFGTIEISGNTRVSDDVVKRQLTFETGQPYRVSRVEESQRRLQRLDLFDFAYVEPRTEDDAAADLPVRVTLVEAKARRLQLAGGYGTEEKVRARAQWDHVNFLGGARTAGIETKWSSLDRGVRVNFTEPYFFSRHFSFSAQGHAWTDAEPVYRLNSYGGQATVRWQRDRRLFGRARGGGGVTAVALTFINERNDYRVSDEALADPAFRSQLIALGLDPDTGAGRGTLSALRLEAERDTTVNRLDPRGGYFVSGAVERAGGFLPGTFTYTEVMGEGRHYWTATPRLTFAQRLRFATIDAPAPTDASVPFFKRYFLGGSTSLRGWGRFSVSPLTESGLPVGGLTLLEASSEVRVGVTEKLRLVAFADAGNVWAEPWKLGPEGLRVDVGPGIRYDTPVGPLRIDLGYQLNPIEGLIVNGKPESRRWRVHLSIGQAF